MHSLVISVKHSPSFLIPVVLAGKTGERYPGSDKLNLTEQVPFKGPGVQKLGRWHRRGGEQVRGEIGEWKVRIPATDLSPTWGRSLLSLEACTAGPGCSCWGEGSPGTQQDLCGLSVT